MEKANRSLDLTCLFGSFVFLQFIVLSLGNHAGEGFGCAISNSALSRAR